MLTAESARQGFHLLGYCHAMFPVLQPPPPPTHLDFDASSLIAILKNIAYTITQGLS